MKTLLRPLSLATLTAGYLVGSVFNPTAGLKLAPFYMGLLVAQIISEVYCHRRDDRNGRAERER